MKGGPLLPVLLLSGVVVDAIYMRLGHPGVICGEPCDPRDDTNNCPGGCLCYIKVHEPQLGACWNPTQPPPLGLRHPREPPPLPPRNRGMRGGPPSLPRRNPGISGGPPPLPPRNPGMAGGPPPLPPRNPGMPGGPPRLPPRNPGMPGGPPALPGGHPAASRGLRQQEPRYSPLPSRQPRLRTQQPPPPRRPSQ